jgi:hypothetical protein
VDGGDGLRRVQVRTTTCKVGDHYQVPLVTTGANRNRLVRRPFEAGDYDVLMIVCGDGTTYVIPASSITARYQLSLSGKWEPYRVEE